MLNIPIRSYAYVKKRIIFFAAQYFFIIYMCVYQKE